ncbi:MAG: hypothetical protein EBS68_08730 [Rhodobacteraceae bacterium]|nr:hypothetical protein [Paracoccaceae bacterium]
MNLDDAKHALRIPDVWAHLNLPGDCRKNPCHSPFYERTSKPSFSVFNDGRAFNDLRTGQRGSVIDFLMLATGLSRQAACQKVMELAGGGKWDATAPTRRPAPAPQARKKPELPPMDNGTESEMRQLAELRSLDFRAVFLARSLDLLRFANLRGHRAWIVTDGDGFNAQARRLDGKPWEHLDGAKSFTLPGCWAGFPLGAAQAENYPAVMLCEGGPDFLAAFHFIVRADRLADVCPVAMLGANQRIHEAALPMLAGKRVTIYAHADDAGKRGAERWFAQLHGIGATVEKFDFTGLRKADGSPVKDLNDCTQIHPDDAAELEDFLP